MFPYLLLLVMLRGLTSQVVSFALARVSVFDLRPGSWLEFLSVRAPLLCSGSPTPAFAGNTIARRMP